MKQKKYCDHCAMNNHSREECGHLLRMNKNNNNSTVNENNEDTTREKEKQSSHYAAVHSITKQDRSVTNEWLLDSGATGHMCNNKTSLTNVRPTQPAVLLTVANGNVVNIKEKGRATLSGKYNTQIPLNDVLYASSLSSNLMSVAKMVDMDDIVIFHKTGARVEDANGTVKLTATRKGDLFIVDQAQRHAAFGASSNYYSPLNSDDNTRSPRPTPAMRNHKDNSQLWHNRLAHISKSGMKKLYDSKAVDGLNIQGSLDNAHVCAGCEKGKHHRKKFAKYSSNSTVAAVLDRVHADLCGPIQVESMGGNRYLSTLIDEKSRRIVGHLIKNKSDTADKIIEWCTQAAVEKQKQLKIFHSDGGGEYKAGKLTGYFKSKGTKVETTLPATPEHNGIAERANRTIFEAARSMLAHAKLPHKFWGEAVMTAIYIRNRCKVGDNNKTPEEIWSGKKPTVKHIRVFGCDVYVHIKDSDRKKLDPKAKKCIFIGYSDSNNGYKVYDPEVKKVCFSRDVTFDETQFTAGRMNRHTDSEDMPPELIELQEEEEVSESKVGIVHFDKNEPVVINDVSDTESTVNGDAVELLQSEQKVNNDVEVKQHEELPLNTRSSKRVPIIPNRLGMVNYSKFKYPRLREWGFSAIIQEPQTFEEAVSGPEAQHWKKAMTKEMNSHEQNHTWTLTDLPEGRKKIGSKWVYKHKIGKDGTIESYKARLCAKGYSQKEGIDYNETFAPVLKYKSLRIILALAAINDLEIKQMDVETAFLNATIKEEVYMQQPEGYETGGAKSACKLNKTLYGTKQAPNEWNAELDQFITSTGYTRCLSDTCIYVRVSRSGRTMILAIFVDDIISVYAKEDEEEWLQYKALFLNKYKMKDLGDAEWVLKMRIKRDRSKRLITIDQNVYIEKVIKQFNMENSTVVPTPATEQPLTENDSPTTDEARQQMKNIPYRSLVGALMYASVSTRPDIAYAVNSISRFMENPGQAHWQAGKRIIRYLNGTSKVGLKYDGGGKQDSMKLTVYADADWAGDIDSRKSTSGMVIKLNNCVISWLSKKQQTVALSTAEAEYMAISAAVQEVKWIKQLLNELKVNLGTEPITLYTDNKAAIAIGENDVQHNRTKHIDIRHHFIRDEVKNKFIKLLWIETKDQLADINTKALSTTIFRRLRDRMLTEADGEV